MQNKLTVHEHMLSMQNVVDTSRAWQYEVDSEE